MFLADLSGSGLSSPAASVALSKAALEWQARSLRLRSRELVVGCPLEEVCYAFLQGRSSSAGMAMYCH
jgi:hypothetical protein